MAPRASAAGSFGMGPSPLWTNRTVTTQLSVIARTLYILRRMKADQGWINMMRYTSHTQGYHWTCLTEQSQHNSVIDNWDDPLCIEDIESWSRVNMMRYTSQTHGYLWRWCPWWLLGHLQQAVLEWALHLFGPTEQSQHNSVIEMILYILRRLKADQGWINMMRYTSVVILVLSKG